MPNFRLSAGAGILIDARDETRLNNKCNLGHSIGAEDITTFQPVALAKEFAYLLQEGTASCSGFSKVDHATLSQQMATLIGANSNPHHVLVAPCGLLVGGEANIFETIQSAFDVGLSLSGVPTAGTQFKLSKTGIFDGFVLHASQGNHPILLNAEMILQFTNAPGDQIYEVHTAEGVSATFTLGALFSGAGIDAGLQTLINSLAAYADTQVTVTGSVTATGGQWNGLLTLAFAGGAYVEPPTIVGGAVQTVTIAGGGPGNYTIDGAGTFQLGASAASVQALIRILGGNYAAAVVDGSTVAPIAAVQTVTFTSVPSPLWAAVQGTGNAALEDVADPTVNADWISAIEACAAYAGQTVTATGAITLTDGTLSGTITFTFSGGPVPLLEVVTGVIDNVTASAPISIDGVTVTPGDSLATIQANLQAAGGPDAEVYVTGVSDAGMAGTPTAYFEKGDGEIWTYIGLDSNGNPYFYNPAATAYGGITTFYLFYNTGINEWALGQTDGHITGDWDMAEYMLGGSPSSPAGISGALGGTYYPYVAPSGTSLNINLLYPTAAGAVAPTVTVGVLTRTNALGTVLAGAAIAQTTAGVAGSGTYRICLPPSITPGAAAATGTGATAATPTAAGTVAAAVVIQQGGDNTAEVYNVVSVTAIDSWVDTGALPEGVSPVQGVIARAHVLAVNGITPTLVITVQHADDNGTNAPDLTTLATATTFTEFTAAGVATINDPAATLKRWWRCNYTITGTDPQFVFCAAVATF